MAVMSALGMVGMWLLWVLTFWITFGVLVVWAVKQWQATTTSKDSPRPARELLEERFAQGDIDREEFERRRRELQAVSPGRRWERRS